MRQRLTLWARHGRAAVELLEDVHLKGARRDVGASGLSPMPARSGPVSRGEPSRMSKAASPLCGLALILIVTARSGAVPGTGTVPRARRKHCVIQRRTFELAVRRPTGTVSSPQCPQVPGTASMARACRGHATRCRPQRWHPIMPTSCGVTHGAQRRGSRSDRRTGACTVYAEISIPVGRDPGVAPFRPTRPHLLRAPVSPANRAQCRAEAGTRDFKYDQSRPIASPTSRARQPRERWS